MKVYIYRGSPLEALGQVGCTYMGGLSSRRPDRPPGAVQGETLTSHNAALPFFRVTLSYIRWFNS
jgi:hypothetical protein